MHFEWNAKKAVLNHRKHGVTFEEASSALRDAFSATTRDPDHSEDEERYVTFGISSQGRLLAVARILKAAIRSGSYQRDWLQILRGKFMKKVKPEMTDELRPEYQRSDFDKIIRGKYASRIKAETNVVILEPDIAKAFPNDEAVNKALRHLLEEAKTLSKLTRQSEKSE
ncbi:BrnT family toxin [Nitrosomonas sp.]|uniref:BrnT family toxin n=1 Tax=Nitrosomonas sp. TaxID=42353 RepID=UPI001D94464E|nr:BrnT family toxin [Nitrosomonas sp.]MBX3615727.1 BrnT family toxin [Nitrosomonas sp.]